MASGTTDTLYARFESSDDGAFWTTISTQSHRMFNPDTQNYRAFNFHVSTFTSDHNYFRVRVGRSSDANDLNIRDFSIFEVHINQ